MSSVGGLPAPPTPDVGSELVGAVESAGAEVTDPVGLAVFMFPLDWVAVGSPVGDVATGGIDALGNPVEPVPGVVEPVPGVVVSVPVGVGGLPSVALSDGIASSSVPSPSRAALSPQANASRGSKRTGAVLGIRGYVERSMLQAPVFFLETHRQENSSLSVLFCPRQHLEGP